MSNFAAEPVPSGLDPEIAEYLSRQFQAIQTSFMSKFIAPTVSALPKRVIPGAVIHLDSEEDRTFNGFYCCVINSQGEGEWKKMEITDLPAGMPTAVNL